MASERAKADAAKREHEVILHNVRIADAEVSEIAAKALALERKHKIEIEEDVAS